MRERISSLMIYAILILFAYIIYSGVLVMNNYDRVKNNMTSSVDIINARKQLFQIEQNSDKLKELYDLCLLDAKMILDEEFGKNKYTKIKEHDYCQERARQSLGLPKDLEELRKLANEPLPASITYVAKKDE